jgi:hypothetical protein
MKWTKEKDNLLTTLFDNGLVYCEIANKINTTPGSIRNRVARLGLNQEKPRIKKGYIQTEQIICINCNKKFKAYKKNKRKFCSQSCSAVYNNKIRIRISSARRTKYGEFQNVDKTCINCNNSVKNVNRKFCSIKCQKIFVKKKIFERIEGGDTTLYEKQYKDYLIEHFGNKCMECGWNNVHPITKKVPIQLEHINGDSTDNNLSNLKLLCPNCHSLTLTYGALNKGNGREKRRLSRQQKK